MKRALLLAAAVVTCLWTTEVRLAACSCIASGPPCQETWQAGAVFAGEVASIEDIEVDRPEFRAGFKQQMRRVTFRVRETFRGIDGGTVVVQTGIGGGDCGYAFSVRQSYLVYAHRYKDQLSVGICSRTRPLADAAEDLTYLRGAARQPAGLATIQGAVRQRDPLSKENLQWNDVPPFAGGRVIVESLDATPTRRYEATTGRDGRYTMQVPAGRYSTRLEVRDGLYATGFPNRLDIPDPRGCAVVDFSVMPDGRIYGRVLDATGQPVDALSVDLTRAEAVARSYYASDQRARTNVAGEFEFSRLAPEVYVLGLMLMQEPKKDPTSAFFLRPPATTPERLSLGPEQRLWAGELQLPESVQLTRITGEVSGATRAAGVETRVYVMTSPNSRIAAGPLTVGPSGNYSFTVVAGPTYLVVAEEVRPNLEPRVRSVRSQPFTAVPGSVSFALRFDK